MNAEQPNRSVFVYGSLMQGQEANRLIASGTCVGRYILSGYEMYNLGSFPRLWPGDGKVIGELWFVDEETLDLLDGYESEGDLYRREQVIVTGPAGSAHAEVYVCIECPEGEPIESEWFTKDSDPV